MNNRLNVDDADGALDDLIEHMQEAHREFVRNVRQLPQMPMNPAFQVRTMNPAPTVSQGRPRTREERFEDSWPLHFACCYGREGVVKDLVAQGADVESRNDMGETPLHCAARFECNRNMSIASYLIEECKANPDAKDDNGTTPFGVACRFNNVETIHYLLPYATLDSNAFRSLWEGLNSWYTKKLVIEHYSKHVLGRGDDFHLKNPVQLALRCPLPSEDAFGEFLTRTPRRFITTCDDDDRLPIHEAIMALGKSKHVTPLVIILFMVRRYPRAALLRDPVSGLFPHEAAAIAPPESKKSRAASSVDLVYRLFRFNPVHMLKVRGVTSKDTACVNPDQERSQPNSRCTII